MALNVLIELFILVVGIYYLYYLMTNYSIIKSSPKLYNEYKNQFVYSLFGALGLILSFQVYYFTTFYEKHLYIEILVKIILGVFSIINQLLITDVNKVKNKIKKKKDEDYYYLNSSKSNKYWGFKIINRLYLLNIVFTIYNKKE